MTMMTRRTLLPLLLALPLLAVMAVLVYWQPAPAAAQADGSLPAPSVSLTVHAACNPDDPRAYLVAMHGKPAGAKLLEYRTKWGKDASWSRWKIVTRPAGQPWPVSIRRDNPIKPGETYRIQMRALDDDGNAGPVARANYYYRISESLEAPSNVTAAYGDDYTEARITWAGSADSDGWFALQHRAIGGKWQVGGWQKAEREDGAYYRDVTGLDAEQGYEFRVTEHSATCQASPWSGVVTLHMTPDAPEFETSTGKAGRAGSGHMMGVWIVDAQESADYHVLSVQHGDEDAVSVRSAMHRFPVEVGQAYEVCAKAGNERGDSDASCRSVTAEISSPIVGFSVSAEGAATGSLDASWSLIPVVKPGHPILDDTVTHTPPLYHVVVREAGAGAWERESYEPVEPLAGEKSMGDSIGGLKGDTLYEVGVRSLYYGEGEFQTSTARTLPYPARNVTVGFVEDKPKRIKVAWDQPSDGQPSGYTVAVRALHEGDTKRVSVRKLGGDARGVTIGGLKAGERYRVQVRAVGESGAKSAMGRPCYFTQGEDGSQSRIAHGVPGRNASCAALPPSEE